MKYIVYQTTNNINNKIYIGVHKTENPDIFDGYIGCGAYVHLPKTYNKGDTILHKALLKYGCSNFTRKVLKIFNNLEDALDLERWLVDDKFINRSDTYNMVLGGGLPPLNNKIVYQFNLDGTLIKTWNSIIEIINFYKTNKDRIWMVVSTKRSFLGCFWSYDNKININEYRLSPRGRIFQYDTNGILLEVFDNISSASLKLDLDFKLLNNSVYSRTILNNYYFLKEGENIHEFLKQKASKLNLNITKVY